MYRRSNLAGVTASFSKRNFPAAGEEMFEKSRIPDYTIAGIDRITRLDDGKYSKDSSPIYFRSRIKLFSHREVHFNIRAHNVIRVMSVFLFFVASRAGALYANVPSKRDEFSVFARASCLIQFNAAFRRLSKFLRASSVEINFSLRPRKYLLFFSRKGGRGREA